MNAKEENSKTVIPGLWTLKAFRENFKLQNRTKLHVALKKGRTKRSNGHVKLSSTKVSFF